MLPAFVAGRDVREYRRAIAETVTPAIPPDALMRCPKPFHQRWRYSPSVHLAWTLARCRMGQRGGL